jgi:hypothetical protein
MASPHGRVHLAHPGDGDTVSPTEQTASLPASPNAGLLASACAAPASRRTPLALLTLLTLFAVLFSAASAFAAAPEKPVASAELPAHAHTVTLNGVLDPGKPAAGGPYETGAYWFVYSESKTSCEGAEQVRVGEGVSLGGGEEHVPAQPVEGLKEGATYTVCLVEQNEAGTEATPSDPVTFTTATAAEAPTTAAAKEATATTVKVEGTLDPKAKAGSEATVGYRFAYSDTGKCTEGAVADEVAPAKVKAGQKVSTTLEGLEPSRTYKVCAVALNEALEPTAGNEVSFTTLASKPTVATGGSSAVNGSSAHVEGTVNPNNQTSECKIEYGIEPTLAKPATVLCEPAVFPAEYGPQPVGLTLSGLSPHTVYYYRVLASNASGVQLAPTIGSFETLIPPEAPQLTAEATSPTTATLHGVLNPGAAGEGGTYQFAYRASESECTGEKTTPEEPGITLGTQGEEQSADLTPLKPGVTYSVCLTVTNSVGETAQATATLVMPPSAPAVESESVSGIETEAATLEAQIDPDGAESTYQFQYGAGETYETSVPASPAALEPNGHETAALEHLTPGKTYHYRVIAFNAQSPSGTPGEDKTFTTQSTPGEPSDTCPNAKLRAEQPYGKNLPDCRAYELVSPEDTHGQDAVEPALGSNRASSSGEAITYGSLGAYASPTGADVENQYVSRRTTSGWATTAITPLHEPLGTEHWPAFAGMAFTPELTAAVTNSNAPLAEGSPPGGHEREFSLYTTDLAAGSYRFVEEAGQESNAFPAGASTDLSHIVLGGTEWIDGQTIPVSVNNNEEAIEASVGTGPAFPSDPQNKQEWHAVSEDGTRIVLTSPSTETLRPQQLLDRVNSGQPQSHVQSPETEVSGTLTEGSSTVSALITAAGTSTGQQAVGSTEFSLHTNLGRFVAGQTVTGPGIAPNTTISNVAGATLTLSNAITTFIEAGSPIASEGPQPLQAGQAVSGNGIPQATTITAVAPGALTLSHPAASSGTAIALNVGGGCTVPGNACTIDLSASQRQLANPAGPRPARYWGASSDGSRVFFTSTAELTENADTGPDGNAANLYECHLITEEDGHPITPRCALTDLTVPTAQQKPEDPDGAAVLGVTQISEDGTYVYFVADGKLAEHAQPGKPNLYLTHDGGSPQLIATLATADESDWNANVAQYPQTEAGPALNTAVVNPEGTELAFTSQADLTGYDTQQARTGQCQQAEGGRCPEIYTYQATGGALACASCNPSGARPQGAAGLEAPPDPSDAIRTYRPRNIAGTGAVFFDSSDRLQPDAIPGQQNVYEYTEGRLAAISDPAGSGPSTFLDASPDGADVFFATAEHLLANEHTGGNLEVYDARTEGGLPRAGTPTACSGGETCKAPLLPPVTFAPGGTSTYQGPANPQPPAGSKPPVKPKTQAQLKAERLKRTLKACRRKRRRSERVACERNAQRRYGPARNHQAKKAGAAGRTITRRRGPR